MADVDNMKVTVLVDDGALRRFYSLKHSEAIELIERAEGHGLEITILIPEDIIEGYNPTDILRDFGSLGI